MKLWQKIFLISLGFVMLAVSVTAAVVAQNYFAATINIEKQSAASRHEYIASGISNRITLEGLSSEELVLSDDRLRSLIRSVVAGQTDAEHGIAVYDESGEIAFSQVGSLITLSSFRAQVESGDAACVIIVPYADTQQLVIGSSCEWTGRRFYLYTSTDITAVYRTREQAMAFIRAVGVASAVVTALILLLIVYRVLSPLSNVNASIRSIAGGAYGERVREKGGYELKELAANVNQMAGAIEENVGHLQEIADSRKRFVDNLAHEMKTPLTSIICLSDVMRIKKNLTDEERLEYAGIIVDEAKRLRNLSGKLLELTVAGNAELDFRDIPLPELLEAIEAAARPVLERSRITLAVEPADCVISCDRALFASMLLNLIDNARKASAAGGTVEVRCALEGDILRLRVIDHGIGMSAEELRHVTEPFYMADKSRSRRAGGAGLGLSLCTEIAARHGGSLSFESSPGEGTTVTLTMPTGGERDA